MQRAAIGAAHGKRDLLWETRVGGARAYEARYQHPTLIMRTILADWSGGACAHVESYYLGLAASRKGGTVSRDIRGDSTGGRELGN